MALTARHTPAAMLPPEQVRRMASRSGTYILSSVVVNTVSIIREIQSIDNAFFMYLLKEFAPDRSLPRNDVIVVASGNHDATRGGRNAKHV